MTWCRIARDDGPAYAIVDGDAVVIWSGCDGATLPPLAPGDTVEVVNDAVGVLRNRIVRANRPPACAAAARAAPITRAASRESAGDPR